SKEMLDAFTREITRILTDGKVTTKQIEHALIQAPLRKYYPYPVPRDWLELCLEQQENGLPDVESVMACFHRYSADRLLYDSPEHYPWPHPVMYWIVLDMRTAMKNRNLSEAELIQLAKRQLKTWSERVGLGEKIPTPVARITDNRRPPAPVRRFETQTSQMTGLAFRKAIQEKLSKVRANQ
ncbi:replication protein P, partial [Plesiomonas shigelloides]|uniref:replication protein P n=1 Tax=Plesiomonas shigelloides TaxID=703 RepID=UPI001C499CC8